MTVTGLKPALVHYRISIGKNIYNRMQIKYHLVCHCHL